MSEAVLIVAAVLVTCFAIVLVLALVRKTCDSVVTAAIVAERLRASTEAQKDIVRLAVIESRVEDAEDRIEHVKKNLDQKVQFIDDRVRDLEREPPG